MPREHSVTLLNSGFKKLLNSWLHMPHPGERGMDDGFFFVIRKNGYVLIVYSGQQTFESLRELLHGILRVCDHCGYGKILLDLRLSTRGLSTVDKVIFAEMVSHLSAVEKRLHFQVAYVVPEDPKGDGFFETAAYNRGLRARRFLRVEEAHEWLVGQQGPA